MNDTQFKIGKLLEQPEARDAIHIAVFPLEAAAILLPGQRVNLYGAGKGVPAFDGPGVGVVDPFLRNVVGMGDRFWLFLHPNTVTDMRHHWTHAAFDVPGTVAPEPERISPEAHAAKSRAWMQQQADAIGLTVDVMLENARSYLEDKWAIVQKGSERWRDNFNATEFWHHYDVLHGTVTPEDMRDNIYCCSCS